MNKYINGNALIYYTGNGNRVIQYSGELDLDYPLNIDIRFSKSCSLGEKCKAKKGYCSHCKDVANAKGSDANTDSLEEVLTELPSGMEITLISNNVTENLIEFVEWCNAHNFLVNLNINQFHVSPFKSKLVKLLRKELINSILIPVRDVESFNKLPKAIKDNESTVAVLHLGVNKPEDIESLNVRSIIVKGHIGEGRGVVDPSDEAEANIARWRWYIGDNLNKFLLEKLAVKEIVFDNLALDQVRIDRFFKGDKWKMFYRNNESVYIDGVKETIAKDSKSAVIFPMNLYSIGKFYRSFKKEGSKD